jgi:uncharacterized protein YecE (DUF72 family)
MNEAVATGYDGKSLNRVATMVRGWAKDSYVFMINGAKVRAPAAALALQERLGIAKA